MRTSTYLWFLMSIIFLSIPILGQAQDVNAQDRAALIAIRNAISQNGQLNWPDNQPVTEWGAPGEISLGLFEEEFRVVALNLEGKNLAGVVPSDLAQLTALDTFDIAVNANITGIEDLPNSLIYLNYAQCDVNVVPDLPRSLVAFFATGNDIATLPNLDNLTSLEYLGVGVNNLTSIPNLDNLTALKRLNVDANNLTELPSLDALTNLEWLTCNNCVLESLPSLESLPNLNNVQLDNNFLEVIPPLNPEATLFELLIRGNNLTFERYFTLCANAGICL